MRFSDHFMRNRSTLRDNQAPLSAPRAPPAPTPPFLRLCAPRAQQATTCPRVSSLPMNISGSFLTTRSTSRLPQAPPTAPCAPTAPTPPILRLRAPRAPPATTCPRVSSLPINVSGSFLTIRSTLRDCRRRHRVHLVPRRHLLLRSCDFVLHVPGRQLRAHG